MCKSVKVYFMYCFNSPHYFTIELSIELSSRSNSKNTAPSILQLAAGGLREEPMAPAYSATKAYQINYMEALRKKLSIVVVG